MPEEHITFRSADASSSITLEGVLYLPGSQGSHPGVVVCHPHPRYGGSMSNNVVFAVCDALAELQIATIRFNFRGVGNSQGEYGTGAEEEFDALGAIDFMEAHPLVDTSRIGLAGYSFGAGVSVRVAQKDPRVQALATVSLPTRNLLDKNILSDFTRPKFFIAGDQDSVLSSGDLQRFIDSLPEPKQVQAVPGADHFWGGYEDDVGPAVAQFFAQVFV